MSSTPIFRTSNMVVNTTGLGPTGPTGPGLYYSYLLNESIDLLTLQLNEMYQFQIGLNLSYSIGQQIIFGAQTSNNGYYFIGTIVNYYPTNGLLLININKINGPLSGITIFDCWQLNLNVDSGPPGPQGEPGANSTVTGPTGYTGPQGDSYWIQTDNNISYINGNVSIGTLDTSLGVLTVSGGVINAQDGIISATGSFTSLTVNNQPVVTSNILNNYAQLSGANFESLTLNNTQVATINDIPQPQDLSGYAQLSGANFTGYITAPTPSLNTNTTQVATTEFVTTAINNLVGTAPNVLDTLQEISTAINDNPDFGTTIINNLALKAPINNPTFTGLITGIDCNLNTLTVNNSTVVTNDSFSTELTNVINPIFTSQIQAPGGITGATGSFSSLLVGGNQVATLSDIPESQNLSNYAQLSGATFYGDVNTVGIVVNNGNSLKMLTPPSNSYNPANNYSTNFIVGNGINGTLWSNYFGIQQYPSSQSMPSGNATVPFVIDYNGRVGINSSANAAPTYTSALTVNGTISTTNLISTNQIQAPGGITGATGSFSSLLVGSNQVATVSQIPNLSGYAQLSGATFTGLINAPGGITGATGSFSSLLVGGKVTATSFNTTSDYRIKEDVTNLLSLDTVDKLRPVRYYNKESKTKDIGLLAHEVQEVYPELVSGEYNGINNQTINYIGLIPVLINEIKMLKQEVKELKEQLTNK